MNQPTVLRGFHKYWAVFRTQLVNSLAYPVDLLARSVAIVTFMWVFAHLWRATYSAAAGPDGQMAGLSLRETLWYLMLAETIVLSKPRFTRTIATSVKDGSIAYLLNKPYNFLLYQVSLGLGDSLMHMLFNLLAGGALVWWMMGPPPPPAGWPPALLAMTLAWGLDFCISAIIGLAAFITEDVTAFEWIYQKVLFLLGGLLIPLDFYPTWLRNLAQALPFAYTVYGPARLFVDPSPARIAAVLAGQLIWLAILGGLAALLFRRGMAWLSINGG